MGRVAIFIDGAYLEYGFKQEFSLPRIDFGRFASKVAGDNEILRTYYYHCLPYQSNPPTTEESQLFGKRQAFYSRLSRIPRFEVKLGKLALRGSYADGRPILIQKRVDIMLGVDLVLLSAKRQIVTAILVAGDSDFLPAVKIAKDEGVLVHLFHFAVTPPHRELWDACDERTIIDRRLIDSVRLS